MVLGLMIAKVSPHHQMTMVDVNHRALHLAEKNKSKIKLIMSLSESDGLSQVENEYFDFVLTNPPIRAGKNVVHRIFEEAYQKLKIKVNSMLSFKKQGMPSAKKKMEEIFNNVETVNKSKGYYILKSQKVDFKMVF